MLLSTVLVLHLLIFWLHSLLTSRTMNPFCTSFGAGLLHSGPCFSLPGMVISPNSGPITHPLTSTPTPLRSWVPWDTLCGVARSWAGPCPKPSRARHQMALFTPLGFPRAFLAIGSGPILGKLLCQKRQDEGGAPTCSHPVAFI